ncbi:MAG TPA: beta-ketoacyl-[acyl-carrier-protein] synthase family protein [Phycisphaerae bacterium]|nr:beta-ketoacyl-[acyl-carrier-protein] synthase family protein [Phycisphaerae bacterium]
MRRRVVVTGIGWVTPMGHDIEHVWQKLLDGRSGVAPTTIFDASTFPTQFSAEVRDFDLAAFLQDDFPQHKNVSRQVGFALAAARQAWDQSRLDEDHALDPAMVGIYMGSGEGPLDFDSFAVPAVKGWNRQANTLDARQWAEWAYKCLSPIIEFEQDPNMAIGHLAAMFNARGPGFNCLTACAASTQAIGEATMLIRRGDADVMIGGGCHSMIHPMGLTGFSRLTALSTRNDSVQTASRPFDRTRDGFVLGEGAGVLILEELQHAMRRGAPVLGEIIGYGSTADAFRITDIHEEGRGAIAAMRGAIDDAGIALADVDYISAHGTATQENDKIETLAIRKLFGDRAYKIPVSSMKSMLGHLIAAAGAVELITCLLAIRDQIIPPTINYQHPDPNCDLDYVPNKPRKARLDIALSNSFGFGGQNDALLVRAHKP